MTNPGQLNDPYLTHRFAVEIDGIVQAAFDECTGLGGQVDVFEYKEGGLNGYTHRLPGRASFSNITLKWGETGSADLWDWYSRLVSKKDKSPELKAVSIIQFDSEHREVHRWNLDKAWPVKWSGPSFNAASTSIAVETLELAFGDLTFVKR